MYTDTKETNIFLIYKDFHMGSGAKSYTRKGFLNSNIWGNAKILNHIRPLVIWLICTRSLPNFLINEENFSFLFISVERPTPTVYRGSLVCVSWPPWRGPETAPDSGTSTASSSSTPLGLKGQSHKYPCAAIFHYYQFSPPNFWLHRNWLQRLVFKLAKKICVQSYLFRLLQRN
jgi:hypothetical protein